MFKNYLKIVYRNLIRHKIFSSINILGLAIGMACTILILLWVQDELSYDRFHKNADYIYRVIHYKGMYQDRGAGTPAPLGPALKSEISDVVNYTRIASPFPKIVAKYGDKFFYENRLIFADPAIFDMFTYPFIKGNPATALSDPSNIIVTEDIAIKYFGTEDPIGKTLTFDGMFNTIVSGVVKNIPHNSHIQFDFLCPFDNIINYRILGTTWGDFNFNTYIQLRPDGFNPGLNQKVTRIAKSNNCPQVLNGGREIGLQPIKEVHLDADTEPSGIEVMSALGDKNNVYMFSLIAFFILSIACINFMNLSTARSANRKMEVGMRKTLGANRFQLIFQFLSESMVMTFISFIIAMMLVQLLLPAFSNFTGKRLTFSISNYELILNLFSINLITGIVAGSYPAFHLSSFPVMAVFKKQFFSSVSLKKKSIKHTADSRFRKALVIIQFSLSISLIIGTLITYKQLQYMKNKNLGFDKNSIVLLPVRENFGTKYEAIKSQLLQNASILSVTAQEWLQLRGPRNTGGLAFDWEENAGNQHNNMISHTRVDYDFIEAMDIKIIEGRNFSKNYSTDADEAFIINEEAAKMMGMKSPVGKKFRLYGKIGKIIGIMQNAYFSSLHRRIEPQVYHVLKDLSTAQVLGSMFVKIKGSEISAGLSFIESIWKRENPNSPFEYQFLDEAIEKRYNSDQRTSEIFRLFATLAIFISCLGLLGLASYTAEQRTKEIGIRKVLGATIPEITILLSREFAKWVLLANILSWPVAYYVMNKWLQNYVYRIDINILVFVFSGGIALLIALLTISYQVIKTAITNPVESLRSE